MLCTLAAYWFAIECDFITFDDFKYVGGNKFVNGGLTWRGIVWAFTHAYASNWHPLAWISHMVDVEIYRLKPWGHHLTNVLLHTANSVLVFLVLRRMTGAQWRSAFVAGLFALHPLRVESVVWVAERKDVLCGFFWLLTIWFYAAFAQAKNKKLNYTAALLCFALALLSKPMAVTLPMTLLLLDFWPLQRIQISGLKKTATSLWRLALEKWPFFLLIPAMSIVTFLAQKSGGAVISLNSLSLHHRATNALISYVSYLRKMVWPSDLAIFYSHPPRGADWPMFQVVLAATVLLTLTAILLWLARRRTYFAIGWFWFLGTIFPVIGFFQVGPQAMADRFTYMPMIGLFIIIAWGASGFIKRPAVLAPLAIATLTACLILTMNQVRSWKDSVTVFTHAIEVTSDNALAHNNLGSALDAVGKSEQARDHYIQALKIEPGYALAHNNLGYMIAMDGKLDKAIGHFKAALFSDPGYVGAMINLGNALATQGKFDEAAVQFKAALTREPEDSDAQSNLGNVLTQQGKYDEAAQHYTASLATDPNNSQTHINFGLLLKQQGKTEEAKKQFTEALRINPKESAAQKALDGLPKK